MNCSLRCRENEIDININKYGSSPCERHGQETGFSLYTESCTISVPFLFIKFEQTVYNS